MVARPGKPQQFIGATDGEDKVWYRNHRGETKQRHVAIDSIEYLHNPGYGYQSGWFISGFDIEKQARRSFAFSNIDYGLGDKNFPLFCI